MKFGCIIVCLLVLGAASQEQIPVNTDRWFRQPFETVWETVLQELTAGGWKVVRAEEGKGIIGTDFLEFPSGKFGPSLATRPRTLSLEYGVFHRVVLDQGRSRFKISIRPSGRGTRVAVAAVIEEHTFHRDDLEYFWAPRGSNGSLEVYLLDRIQKAMEESPSTEPPAEGGSDTP